MITELEKKFLGYSELIQCWTWEWFVTLTFDPKPFHDRWYQASDLFEEFRHLRRFGPDVIKKMLLIWIRDLCTRERIQVGFFWALIYKSGQPHVHLLMLGRSKTGRTLDDVKRSHYEAKWLFFAKVEQPRSNETVSDYLEKNGTVFPWDTAEIDFYNLKLLKRLKQQPQD